VLTPRPAGGEKQPLEGGRDETENCSVYGVGRVREVEELSVEPG
jgi:hypothetical protein